MPRYSPFIVSLFSLVVAPMIATAEFSLSSAVDRLEAMPNIDPLDKRQHAERVQTGPLTENLPRTAGKPGKFFQMAVKPGDGGYPGAKLPFNSPVDFSKHDVLAIWLKVELPISYLSLVFHSANGTDATYNLHAAALTSTTRFQPGQWHRVYLPYKAVRSEIRPAGNPMEFSQITGLMFYTHDESLSIKPPAYKYSFGGMELLSMDEARAQLSLTRKAGTLFTAAKLGKDDDVLIWTADAGEKVLKNTPLPDDAPIVDAVSTTAAGNEYASLLFVVNPTRDLTNLTAQASDLVCGENRIEASNVVLRFVDEVFGMLFDAPDPLPLLSGERGRSAVARSGENFQFWTTVYVPQNTPPGTYAGQIDIKDAQGLNKSVPVKLEVYGFALPKTHLQTLYTIQDLYGGPKYLEERSQRYWGTHVAAYSEQYNTIVRNIIHDFGDHRLTPLIDISDWFYFISPDERKGLTEKYNFDPAYIMGINIANNYAAVAPKAEAVTPEQRAEVAKSLKAAAEHFRKEGLADKTAVKIDDEASGERLKFSLMAAQDAAEHFPFIENFMTATARLLPEEFFGFIDIWCVVWHVYDFDSPQFSERKAAGDRFWVYGVDYRNNNAYEPMEIRAPYWLFWQYGIAGTHYSHDSDVAYLTYPNETYQHSDGLKTIPSIRWEMIRHGAQDYEYLWTLNDLIQKNPEKGEPYKNLLEVPNTLAASTTKHTYDPRPIAKQRELIARAIEALSQ